MELMRKLLLILLTLPKSSRIDALGSVDKYELIVTTSAESFTYVIERENLYKLEKNLAKENSLCFIFHGKDEVFKTYIYEQVKHQQYSTKRYL